MPCFLKLVHECTVANIHCVWDEGQHAGYFGILADSCRG